MSCQRLSSFTSRNFSETKIHKIQSYEAGGIYNRLLSIHVAVRNALKIFLRVFESLAGVSQTYGEYQAVHPYTHDTKLLVDEFSLLTVTEAKADITDEDVDRAIPATEDGWREVLREKLALERVVERNASMHVKLISDLDEATAVAVLGKALHGSLVDLLVTFIILCYLKHICFYSGMASSSMARWTWW